MQEEDIDIGIGRQIAPAVAADRHNRESVGRGWIRLWIDRACRAIQLHAEQLVDQGGLGRDDLGARCSGIEAPAELSTAIVTAAPHQFEGALPVVSPEPGNRACKSASVEDARRRVRRVHRCTRGPQAALGRIPPDREPHAEPGSMVLQRAPNTGRPQAHADLRSADGVVMYNRERRRDCPSKLIARPALACAHVRS